jgi:Putative amidoligase enzyme
MKSTERMPLPPETHTRDGEMRRLGVEIEFSGMSMDAASAIVEDTFGGNIDQISAFEHRVQKTCLGDFNVELDYEYLKTLGREDDSVDRDSLLDQIPQQFLAEIARRLVPIEVVSPPIAMDKTGRLNAVVGKLREAGARGTRHSPLYAFGLHLNPEMPALDAETIGAYLRAFLCLYEWLLRVSEVDWTRRVTPYINPFPSDYVQRVVTPDYAPPLSQLIDDYLASNADRNRALDMLPLFAHLDESRVRAVIDDPRIKARPTLHYRLANCDVDVPGWGIHTAWRHWLEVERLAADPDRLRTIAEAYLEHLGEFKSRAFGDWATTCEQWLDTTDP